MGTVPGIRVNVDRDLFTEEIFLDDISEIQEPDNAVNNFNTQTIDYTVQRGDTLSEIATRFGTTVQEIAQINGIQNVNLIFPGEVLRIVTNSNIQGSESNSTNKTYYTIKQGDTLSEIAIWYRVPIQKIIEWNNIQNPNLIFPGQRLILFGNYKNTDTSTNNNIFYTVQKGDTLFGIARRYKICVKKLARINGIINPNLIYPGQILKIN